MNKEDDAPLVDAAVEEALEVLQRLASTGMQAAPTSQEDAFAALPPTAESSDLPAVPVDHWSEDILRELLESLHDAMVVINSAGAIVLVNEQTELMFGYRREELLDQPVELLIPERFRPQHIQHRRDYFAHPRSRPMGATLQLQGRRKDGTLFPVEIGLSPIRTEYGTLATGIIRDISRREREAAKFRTLVENIPAVTFVAPLDESVPELYVSPQIEQLLGFTQKEWIEDPVLWHRQLHPEDRERWNRQFAPTCASGEPFRSVYRFIAKDGRVVWVHGSARTVRDAEGKLLFLQGVAFDITSIKEAEEAVREQARLAVLRAEVSAAITRTDTLLAMLQRSAAALVQHLSLVRAWVWTFNESEQILELLVTAGIAPMSQGAPRRLALGQLAPGRIAATREPLWTNDARRDHRLSELTWLPQDGLIAFAGTPLVIENRLVGVLALFAKRPFSDAAWQTFEQAAGQLALGIERRRAEEALRASEERIRLLLNSTAEAIYGIDLEGRCSFCNAACARLLGYATPEQLLGQDMHAVTHYARADGTPYPVEECRIYQTFRRGETSHETEEVFWRADGTRFPAEYWSYPMHRRGQLIGAVVTFLDITERKRLEEQFRQAQKMEAVGRLAGGVAHDFNNLLTIINGYGELLLQTMPPGGPQREMIQQMTAAGERAAGLTRQLLAFSRRSILEPKLLNLRDEVLGVEKLLRRVIGEDIQLTTVAAADIGLVLVDRTHIEQVLLNLAVNARDAMPQGGKLTIELSNVKLDEAYTRSNPDAHPGLHVLLAVSDTGCGMDKATQARIFEPFFTTKGDHGTGLGLATVYGIIKQSGGHIAVYSEPGAGTVFKVFLPRVLESKPLSSTERGADARLFGDETILLVEDEESVRTLARLMLEDYGYNVLVAGSGADALRLVEQHQGAIDLLLTDVVMPRMSGPEMATRLASRHPEMKVLYMSGYTNDAVVRHGVLEAEVQFLQKPFTPLSLSRKVRETLDR